MTLKTGIGILLRHVLFVTAGIVSMQSCSKKGSAASTDHANVTTLAGDTVNGFNNATGMAARFGNPAGVATDASGIIYVADSYNNCIRKITPDGMVTTLAGGTYGFVDGKGSNAEFRYPFGVATDASGNIYVADTYNHRIRKITPDGSVTTLAGNGTNGFADGKGRVAEFNYPYALAINGSDIYVADSYNSRIRKITPDSVVSTLAGGTYGYVEGKGSNAKFTYPYGIAIDASGNVYVSDINNDCIRKITPDSVVSTLAGSGGNGFADGNGINAMFDYPYGVATDAAGNIYVGDYYNNRIRKITPAGLVSTLAGSGIEGFADGEDNLSKFSGPFGVAVDAFGTVYVADYGNNCIRKIK